MRGSGDHRTLARLERDLRVARAKAPELLHPPVSVVEQRALAEERGGRAAMDAPGGIVELARRERGTRPRTRADALGGMVEVLDEHADLGDEDLRARGWRLARGVRD